MTRIERIKSWLIWHALSWFFVFMGVIGGLAIVLFTGRHPRLRLPLLIGYEALIIYSAMKSRPRVDTGHKS